MKGLNYYGGQFREGSSGQSFDVISPYDGSSVGTAVTSENKDVQDAIHSIAEGFKIWSQWTGKERGKLLYKLYEKVMANMESLAEIMTLEQGKPIKEARIEVVYGASFIKWYAEEASRVYGDIVEANHKGQRLMVLKQPVGPVGIITPWNFPLAMITRKLAPALASGCTAIVKPAEETPLTAMKLFELIHETGFPPGVVALVTGKASMIGQEMMASMAIRKVSFTGSTAVGQILVRQSADTMKKLSLELGGHAPLIVFDDADLEKAVQGTLDSKFRNCGQVCIASNRIYVHRPIYEAYVQALKTALAKLKSGFGLEDVDLGPLINKAGYDKVVYQVEDALNRGASMICGGKGHSTYQESGYFFEPTILSDMTEHMVMMQEETFGPILPITLFDTEEEVLQKANASPFGLASYFFTENLSRSIRVQEGLEYGMVGVNTGKISSEQVPFGGVKLSGYGREGGYYGIEEYLQTKYVCVGV